MDVRELRMDSYLQQTFDEIQRATAGISAEQLAWHPEGKWSPAEILEHLTLAFSRTAQGMERALNNDANPAPQRTMKQKVSVFVVTALGYLPEGRKAPKGTVPAGTNAADPVGEIIRQLTAMDVALTKVEQKKGAHTFLEHPILGPLTIRQWRKFHLVHTKHHMKQIARLRVLAS